MDPCCDASLRGSQIEAMLREPLVRWSEASPVAVREIVESAHGVGAAILAVAVDAAASPDRSDLTERVIAALSEAVTGTYPAWLPEAEHLAGPGGAGSRDARDLRASSQQHGPVRPVPHSGRAGVVVRAAGWSGGVRARDGGPPGPEADSPCLRVWTPGGHDRADGYLEHRADRSRGSERTLARRARRADRMALRGFDRVYDARAPFFPARPDAGVGSAGYASRRVPDAAAGPTQRVQPGRDASRGASLTIPVGDGSRLEPDLVVGRIGQFHPGPSHLVARTPVSQQQAIRERFHRGPSSADFRDPLTPSTGNRFESEPCAEQSAGNRSGGSLRCDSRGNLGASETLWRRS